MAKMERVRETIQGKLDLDDMQRKYAAGWRLVGLEWERESAGEEQRPAIEGEVALAEMAGSAPAASGLREVPFGFRVAADCAHLEEDPSEIATLNKMMEFIVQDISMSRIADELNRAGAKTRDGAPWTALTIFNVFPRLIELTPRIFRGPDWQQRRRELGRITWNS